MDTIHHLSKEYAFVKKDSNILTLNFYKMGTRREYNVEINYFTLCQIENQTIFMRMTYNKSQKNVQILSFPAIHINNICGFHFATAKKIDDDDQLIMSLLGKEFIG